MLIKRPSYRFPYRQVRWLDKVRFPKLSLRPGLFWWLSLAAYSLFIVLSGNHSPAGLIALPFYVAVPGYALSTVFLPKVGSLNKIGFSLLASPAIAITLRSLTQIIGLYGTISEVAIMGFLSTACFSATAGQDLLGKKTGVL